MNRRHALVLAGNKAAVMKFEDDGKTFRLISVDAFKTWHLNRAITLPGDGKPKRITHAELWLNDRDRREFEGIEFAPAGARKGYYNLWQGFAVEPRPGDCGKFLAHIRDNIAQGNTFLYNWIVGFFAQIVQQPDVKLGTALALRGEPGVGKTKVGEVFGSLLKPHYKLVADPRFVTGQFNCHMASLLLLHADEAFWAGDKRSEGKLKDLVTGTEHFLGIQGRRSDLGPQPDPPVRHRQRGLAGAGRLSGEALGGHRRRHRITFRTTPTSRRSTTRWITAAERRSSITSFTSTSRP